MKDSIIVNVFELRSALQDIRRSGCDVVSLTINESENIDGGVLPACISLSGCRKSDPGIWYDFDPIDAVENESELKEKSFSAITMSSNLL